jgi:hypothetical protein
VFENAQEAKLALKSLTDWLDQIWEDADADGGPCEGCKQNNQWQEKFPFDVEPRLQVWQSFRECEAKEPADCPHVQEMVDEVCGYNQ